MHQRIGAFVIFCFFSTILFHGSVFAQSLPAACIARTDIRDEVQLRADLAACEAEIKRLSVDLEEQRKKTGSISKEVSVLTTQIKLKQAEIQKKNKLLSDLSGQIQNRNSKIESLHAELNREQESLAKMLRKQNLLEDYSFTHFLLSGKTVSEFYSDIDTFAYLKSALTESFNTIEKIRTQTEVEKEQLQNKQEEQKAIKKTLEIDKRDVEAKKGEKQVVLNQSKSEEQAYQKRLAEKQKHATTIRQKLFALRGVEGGGLQFGEAYRLAKEAGKRAGVRPAFILAILKQETNFGSNVGQCFLSDTITGAGVGVNTGTAKIRTMSPTRDVPIFIAMTDLLGLDYKKTRVSCWIPIYGTAGQPTGWGGAMGISQFIPSTWAAYGGLTKDVAGGWVYSEAKDRIRSVLGSNEISNPWNHLHGITASALFLRDLGASAQTYAAERSAACKYYTGTIGCASRHGANYGNSVMSFAAQIQRDIDVLEDAE